MVWHRDHGGSDGWAHPSFDVGDVDALTNGDTDPLDAYEDRYPVMFNISCSTGRFDQETDDTIVEPEVAHESFADEMLRSSTDAGVVAVIAAGGR